MEKLTSTAAYTFKNLPQPQKDEEEADNDKDEEHEPPLPLPTPSNAVINQVLEKLDLLIVIFHSCFQSIEKLMDSHFQSLEKSVKDKYNEMNDRLTNIKIDQSYHFFKLNEYFQETRHGNLPSPSLIRSYHHSSPSQTEKDPSLSR